MDFLWSPHICCQTYVAVVKMKCSCFLKPHYCVDKECASKMGWYYTIK